MSHLAPNQMHQLIDQAEPYYLASGFHVGEHRLDVLEAAQELSALALSQGIKVDGQIVTLACNWHDAGLAFTPGDVYVHDKDTLRPAGNSEEVAVELFSQAAHRMDAPQRLIKGVNEAIASTNPLVAPKTVEAKIVAAADVHGVGFNPYDKFVTGTQTLWEEAKWRQAREIDWPDFAKGSMRYLGLFMGRDIQLTPDYYDKLRRSAWHVGAVSNVRGLAEEVWDDVSVRGSWPATNDFRLSIGDESERIDIALPTHANVLPLPSDMLDSLYISERVAKTPGIAKEIGRVLRDSGVFDIELTD